MSDDCKWLPSTNTTYGTKGGALYNCLEFFDGGGTPYFGGSKGGPSVKTGPYIQTLESDTAENFANDFLSIVACDGGLSTPSSDLYGCIFDRLTILGDTEKAKLKNATSNPSGTLIERFAARYDYLVAKYESFYNYLGRNRITIGSAKGWYVNGGSGDGLAIVVALGMLSAIGIAGVSALPKEEADGRLIGIACLRPRISRFSSCLKEPLSL